MYFLYQDVLLPIIIHKNHYNTHSNILTTCNIRIKASVTEWSIGWAFDHLPVNSVALGSNPPHSNMQDSIRACSIMTKVLKGDINPYTFTVSILIPIITKM